MSWQRIFELARRQKSPLIITDIAGREPIVVLPLDAYERLVDGSSVSPSHVAVSVPVTSSVFAPGTVTGKVSEKIDLAPPPKIDRAPVEDKIVLQEIAEAIPPVPISAVDMNQGTASEDLLLEEKFYLEPVDDDQK